MRIFIKSFFLLIILLFSTKAFSESKTFKIGVILPLSGNLAHVGNDIQKGMHLAVKDSSDKNLKIEIIFEDDQFIATKAVTAVKKLVLQDKVDALVSLWDMADLVAITAEQHKIPHLAIRWNPEIAQKFEYSFTIESTYHTAVKEQIKLLKTIGVESIAILGTEEKSTSIASSETEKIAKKNGIKIVYKKLFSQIDTSFNSLIHKVINSSPDAILFWLFPPNLELALQKAKTLSSNSLFHGMFNNIPAKDKHLVNELPFVIMYKPAGWFIKKFNLEYGKDFEIRAPHAYDVVMLLSNAAISHKEKEITLSSHIVNYLKIVKNYPGASGTLTTNNTKSIENEIAWMIMKDGRPEVLTKKHLKVLKTRIINSRESRMRQ